LKVTGDRPGTQDRHFWVPEYTASSPQSSTSNGVPPSEVTASTMVRQPCRCASAAKVWASDCAPVEVSACTNARTLASGLALSTDSTLLASTAAPQLSSTITAMPPQRSTFSFMRPPKTPFWQTTTLSPGST